MAKKGSKFDRQCSICGKHYEYCPMCSRFKHMERWHDAYCSKNCKDLYNVTAGFINGWLEPEVEAARLKELDLSYKDKLPDWIKNTIDRIQKIDISNADAINKALKEEDVPTVNIKEENIQVDFDESKDLDEQPEKKADEKKEKKFDAKNKFRQNKNGK